MHSKCKEFIDYVLNDAPQHDKAAVEKDVVQRFCLTRDRKVYHNNYYAVRFSYSKSQSFSKTVLSLSALEKYDKIPFFVVLVRLKGKNEIMMANSTFLKKISHSSQSLTMTNIRGSFNGSDIVKEYEGYANDADNFDELLSIHQGLDWEDNLQRLVDASSQIKPVNKKFMPDEAQRENIIRSVGRAASFVASADYDVLKQDLDERCSKCKNEIFIASRIENVNIRGRLIESLITADEQERENLMATLKDMEQELPAYDTKNGLGDYVRKFDGCRTYTDIKTKVVYLDSNPKAYNVDKFLECMAEAESVFMFYFVGVDEKSVFSMRLCSVYHHTLLDNTLLQPHWAGRSTRGAAQFKGKIINEILSSADFINEIDTNKSEEFLNKLMDM